MSGIQHGVLERMRELLLDGLPHSTKELHALCGPSSIDVVRTHISRLRKRLPAGHRIINTVVERKTHYQMVRMLNDPSDGRT